MKGDFTDEDILAGIRFRKVAKDKGWVMPLLMADVVLLTIEDETLKVLVSKRIEAPHEGRWSLPGAFVLPDVDQDIEHTALRGLKEKTDVEAPYLEQLQTFSGADRDPRGWSSSNAYLCVVSRDKINFTIKGHEIKLMTFDEVMKEKLAFDHADILAKGIERLRAKGGYSSLAAHLLPQKFTLSQLQRVYEIILDHKLDKSAFRKKMREANFVEPCAGEVLRAANRPALLYKLTDTANLAFFRRNLAP